jgi:hypothetical protein
MNMITLAYMVGAIMGTLSLVLFGWLFVDSLLTWLEPRRRAGELLLAVPTREHYYQLMRRVFGAVSAAACNAGSDLRIWRPYLHRGFPADSPPVMTEAYARPSQEAGASPEIFIFPLCNN